MMPSAVEVGVGVCVRVSVVSGDVSVLLDCPAECREKAIAFPRKPLGAIVLHSKRE